MFSVVRCSFSVVYSTLCMLSGQNPTGQNTYGQNPIRQHSCGILSRIPLHRFILHRTSPETGGHQMDMASYFIYTLYSQLCVCLGGTSVITWLFGQSSKAIVNSHIFSSVTYSVLESLHISQIVWLRVDECKLLL